MEMPYLRICCETALGAARGGCYRKVLHLWHFTLKSPEEVLGKAVCLWALLAAAHCRLCLLFQSCVFEKLLTFLEPGAGEALRAAAPGPADAACTARALGCIPQAEL